MQNNLRKKYLIRQTNTQAAYTIALSLKNNAEYEKMVDDAFLSFANIFKKLYPKVKLETPRGREKSKKSIKNKIEKLEIERLCKLYCINEISNEEKIDLYNFIIEKTNHLDINLWNKILFKKIQSTEQVDEILKTKEMEDYIKTAILRIAYANFKQEQREKEQIELDEKYGEIAAKRSGQLKDNLLHIDAIEKIDDKERKKLHSPLEYLKVKDLRGFKFIVAYVPSNIQTDNERLKRAIRKREEFSEEEKSKYNDLCCIELTKDFVERLLTHKEDFGDLNIEIVKDGYKHKQKQNGYIAEHIKFCSKDNPEYTFEMQLRSIYTENRTRANGVAAHDRRAGKKRSFPNIEDKNKFLKELEETLPSYRMLELKNGKYELRKCNMVENMLEYFVGYEDFDNLTIEEYDRVIGYMREKELEK